MPSTLRMIRMAGDLTWTWWSSIYTPSTGSLASLSSASSAISSSSLFKEKAHGSCLLCFRSFRTLKKSARRERYTAAVSGLCDKLINAAKVPECADPFTVKIVYKPLQKTFYKFIHMKIQHVNTTCTACDCPCKASRTKFCLKDNLWVCGLANICLNRLSFKQNFVREALHGQSQALQVVFTCCIFIWINL